MTEIDRAQRTAARVAGLAYLLATAVVVVGNFALRGRLLVAGDPAATMRNIAAGERLFRASLAFDLSYCVGVVVVVAALYVVLRPVGPHLALQAAVGRFVHGLSYFLIALTLFAVLHLSASPDPGHRFGPEPAQALVQLLRTGSGDLYYAGLLFWALAATACFRLWHKSRYVPAGLALVGLVASAWCVLCTVWYIVNPGFTDAVNLWWFDSPMVLCEIAVAVWLIVRGLPAPAAVRA
jgi:hypothetical protein